MIRVVGMGPGNIKYLSIYALDIIKTSKHLVAFGRLSKDVEKLGIKTQAVNTVKEVLNLISKEENVDILASGDPEFYGIVEYLKRNGVEIAEVVPGISSFQYMMAKLQKSWQKFKFMSLHGREEDIKQIKQGKDFVILTDKINTPKEISRKLYELGVRGKIYVGFNLSYENEKIITGRIGDSIEDISKLSVVVIENEMD